MYQPAAVPLSGGGFSRAQRSRRHRFQPWPAGRDAAPASPQDGTSPTHRQARSGEPRPAFAGPQWGRFSPAPEEPLVEPLTAREKEVLGLLMEAATNQEIADRLCVSLRTVESHLGHIYGKLGVRGRPEAMLWAMRMGVSS